MSSPASPSGSASEPAGPFARASGGVRVALKVTPGAARDAIGPLAPAADGEAALKVSVTAAPERGRANAAVIGLLAKAWGMPKSAISLTAGAGGRRKTVYLAGEPDALMRRLDAWLARHDG